MAVRLHSQRPIKGGRIPLSSCLLKEIRREVERLSIQYRVSKSWVVATILAEALKIDGQPSYLTAESAKEK